MADELPADELFRQVFDRAPSRDPSAALTLGADQWMWMAARPATAEDAETCRLLSLAALEPDIHDPVAMVTWRSRALTRFALLGWQEGIAALLMGDAFRALSIVNADYPEGRTLDKVTGSRDAISIIEQIEPFSHDPGSGISVGRRSPSPALVRRWLYEKRGFFRMVTGDFAGAGEDYDRALVENEGSRRGQIKVRLGRALVDYLAALPAGVDPAPFVGTTAQLRAQLDQEDVDLLRASGHNLEVMRRGGEDVMPYEYL